MKLRISRIFLRQYARLGLCGVALIVITTAALLLCPLSAFASSGEDTVSVEPIKPNSPGFIKGMDVSSVISLENAGVTFKNRNGEEEDIFKILADNGVNTIRVRVWNDPYTAGGRSYGGGNSDIDTAVQIGRRAARYGMKLMVDFHYSDFWADPGKQSAPKAWKGLSLDEKAQRLYDFTLSSLQKLREEGADIRVVQVGNETNDGIAGEWEREGMVKLFNVGAKAVRDFDQNVLVALHFTNPERGGLVKYFADFLSEYAVDYDVYATSYYPYWHGSLDNLTNVLSYVAETYGKYVMVAETSYANTLADTDGHENTVSEQSNSSGENLLWQFSCQGQADEVRAVMNAVNNVGEKGLGVCYWEGAWITAGDITGKTGGEYEARYNQNKELWEEYGCGWASSASSEYDPDDAGRYYGGSPVDNQAFFDAQGRALPSLRVFLAATVLYGDADGSGRVDINDATAVQKHVAQLITLGGERLEAADINHDGKVNINDATDIQRMLAAMP